jgi:hypothetical protein
MKRCTVEFETYHKRGDIAISVPNQKKKKRARVRQMVKQAEVRDIPVTSIETEASRKLTQ